MCRICGCRAWCTGASCARHAPGSKLDSVDEAAVKAMPGVIAVVRDGSFLGVVAEREEQAIKARQALMQRRQWTLGPSCPIRPKIHDVLLALPAEDNVISDKQAPMPDGANVIEATYRQALHGTCLDRSILCARRIQGRQDDGVDAYPGRVSAAAITFRSALNTADCRHPLHPYRRFGLLRP